MAYRFKLGERFGKGLRRIGAEEIERAMSQLDLAAPGIAVHETRKSTKRLRALLKLVRTGLAKQAFARENARLRDIARLLSASRDSAVLHSVIDRLAADAPASGQALARLRGGLGAGLPERVIDAAEQALQARASLHEAGIAWRKLKLEPSDFAPIACGLADGLRRLRLTCESADADDDETFHEWRKTVQLHWRHMRLVEAAWPGYFDARAVEAKAISELLGTGQDLTLFLAHVNGEAGERLTRKQARALGALAETQRDNLRAVARERCQRLVAEGADGFVRRATVYWDAAVEFQRHDANMGLADAAALKLSADDKPQLDNKPGPQETEPEKAGQVLEKAAGNTSSGAAAVPALAPLSSRSGGSRRRAGARRAVSRGSTDRPGRSQR